MGWLEYIIVTPSQHRVHHAINPIYIDKNLAAIFCIWDRAFGTFQEELDEEPCVYGVTRQANTWNPIKINFQHLWLLVQDAWRAKNWRDKLRIWFMPTGWRPEDVKAAFPIISADHKNFTKYTSNPSTALIAWSWVQFIIMILLLVNLLLGVAKLDPQQLLLGGGFIFLMVYSFTSLMDGERSAFFVELAKSALGIAILSTQGDWFLMSAWLPGVVPGLYAYFVFSVLVVGAFVFSKRQNLVVQK
jgi:hypothetical protein